MGEEDGGAVGAENQEQGPPVGGEGAPVPAAAGGGLVLGPRSFFFRPDVFLFFVANGSPSEYLRAHYPGLRMWILLPGNPEVAAYALLRLVQEQAKVGAQVVVDDLPTLRVWLVSPAARVLGHVRVMRVLDA